MKPTPFVPAEHLAPIPFGEPHLEAARRLKKAGLPWTPHVGCFVWDPDGHIEVGSPFPSRVYFILNLGHFLRRFDTVDAIVEKLVWLPTWHQARTLCELRGVELSQSLDVVSTPPGEELLELYERLRQNLES